MSEKQRDLQDLLEHEVKDLFSAENQLIEALPKMAKKASDSLLKQAIQEHLEETKGQAERLQQAMDLLGINPGRKKCKAMAGLIKEGEEWLEENASKAVKDAGIIAISQKVEHYEISGYGSACYYAEMLGLNEVQQLLSATLEEEQMADTKLNDIAKSDVNRQALSTSNKGKKAA
jgi:ferritin-like metal-binding protein YciE